MKTSKKLLLAGFAILVLASFGLQLSLKNEIRIHQTSKIIGDGNITEKNVPASPASEMVIKNHVVVYLQIGEPKITTKADNNLQDLFEIIQENGKLSIGTKKGIPHHTENELSVILSMPEINNIQLRNFSKLICKDSLKMESLQISTSDHSLLSAKVFCNSLNLATTDFSKTEINGSVNSLQASGSDHSDMDCPNLTTKLANIAVSDFSSAQFQVADRLQASAKDHSSVIYTGMPTDKNISTDDFAEVKQK